ncbi:MAG: endonuclease/exonuclease/phosphatase family protein [Polyangiaceae bacterium]
MRPIRIVSYNVRYFGHGTRGLVSTRRSMEKIAKAISALDPLADVVCLQEVETRSFRSLVAHRADAAKAKAAPSSSETQLERLMPMLSAALAPRRAVYEAFYFPAHAYAVTKGAHIYTTGLAVLVHRDFVVDHHNAGRPHDITHRRIQALRQLKQTRICAHVRVRRRGDGEAHAIDVFNTHLSLPSSMTAEFWMSRVRMGYGKNQLEEARTLARFVEKERKSDRFVVLGDFNSLPGSPVYQHLVGEMGYEDPFARLHRMSVDELRSWPTAGFMQLRMHLDHVLSGKGMRWLDFDESHPFGDRTSMFHGLSDHMPIIGRCRA